MKNETRLLLDETQPQDTRAPGLSWCPEQAAKLRESWSEWPCWELMPRQMCDLELLINGGFSPLETFLGQADHESVCARMRLADGTLWPVPVVLDIPDSVAKQLSSGTPLALRDAEGVLLAALHVDQLWQPNLDAEAVKVFGTGDPNSPDGRPLRGQVHPWYVSGRLEVLQSPKHGDFESLRLTPSQVREEFARRGWNRVVAFQTSDPMHRADFEMTYRAARDAEAKLLIQPLLGMAQPGASGHYSQIRCYQAVLRQYPKDTAMLALLPLAPRGVGPREVLRQALLANNFGCTHLIGPPVAAAAELLLAYEREIGVQVIARRKMVFLAKMGCYVPEDNLPPGTGTETMTEAQLHERLGQGRSLPEWFTFPEVAQELRRRHPPRHKQGFTVFFTGLSGSGKSTIARVLQGKLLEHGGRGITLLDGDLVRKHLSSELGFSREHRDLNIRRIGWVASEITKHGGIALCAPIAPYDPVRREVRACVETSGGFVLVHVATPLEVCESRDRKGLYAKARAGKLPQFTGISDPYEVPQDADIVIDTTRQTPEESAQVVLGHLEREGYLSAAARNPVEMAAGAGRND
jgi:sulfate adenylyltransferase